MFEKSKSQSGKYNKQTPVFKKNTNAKIRCFLVVVKFNFCLGCLNTIDYFKWFDKNLCRRTE